MKSDECAAPEKRTAKNRERNSFPEKNSFTPGLRVCVCVCICKWQQSCVYDCMCMLCVYCDSSQMGKSKLNFLFGLGKIYTYI